MESGSQWLLLGGLTLVIFRPRDLPVLSRAAGRALGILVRGARVARASALQAMEDATAADRGGDRAGRGGGGAQTLTEARKRLAQSVSIIDEISHTLRRDVSPLGLDARQLVRPGRVPAQSVGGGAAGDRAAAPVAGKAYVAGVQPPGGADDQIKWKSTVSLHGQGHKTEWPGLSGADIVASVIEEDAFARQKAVVLGRQRTEGANRDVHH